MSQCIIAREPVIPGRLQRAGPRELRDASPEIRKRLYGALASACEQALRKHDGIYRAGACRADAFDFEPRLFQEAVQDTPGEGAVSAAALQRKIGNFHSDAAGMWKMG